MLEYNPEKRITAKKALNHHWFQLEKKENEKNIYLKNEMNSMKQFCKLSRFQNNIVTFISHNLLTSKSLGNLEKKFSEIDKNKDGRISWK